MRLSLLFIFSALSISGFSQITSTASGNWNTPSNWSCNCIPSSANGTISISHNIDIPSGFAVTIDETTITLLGSVNVLSGGTLTIANVSNALVVSGTLQARQGSTLTGTTGTNISFNSGSTYIHSFTTTEGVIPKGVWNAASTLLISGYTSFSSATSANWSQSFGNVTWNCASQSTTFALNGLLKTVRGDFTLSSSNGNILQFGSNQRLTISVSGNFNVLGNSRINVNDMANSTGLILNINGNFNFTPTLASTSFLTTTGNTTVNVKGNFTMNKSGAILYLSNATNNTAVGTLNCNGNFTLTAGTITEGINDGTGAIGRIYFVNTTGLGHTHVFVNSGTISNQIQYQLSSPTDTLKVLGESQVIGNASSTFTLNGTLIVQSSSAAGAIQTGFGAGAGNIRTTTRTYNTGSYIVYGGSTAQVIGNGHIATASVVIDNPAGVSINVPSTTTVSMANLTIVQGTLTMVNTNLSVNGASSLVLLKGGNFNLNSTSASRTLSFNALSIAGGNMTLSGTTNSMTLNVNGDIIASSGSVTISNTVSTGTLNTFGNLTSTGGTININSGTGNIFTTIRGNITGTDVLLFSGNNNTLTISGSGALSRSIPFIGSTTLENIIVNRPSSIVQVSVPLTVTNNFTVQNGNVDLNASTLVRGDLNVAKNNTVFFESQILELQKQFNSTLFGGLLSADALSSLRLTGTGNIDTLFFSPTGNTIGRLTLNRPTGGTLLVCNSVLNISDSLELKDGVFRHTSGLSMNSGSNLLLNSNASIIGIAPGGGPYNIIYQGASQNTGLESLGIINDLIVNSSGTVTLNNAITVTGQLQINTGVFTANGNSLGVASISNLATFTAPSTTLTITGNWVNSGSFNHNNGTIAFSGITNISGSVNVVANHILIGGTLNSPALLELKGNFTNNGTFTSGTGTLRFSGTSLQTVAGTSISTFNNINVTNVTAVKAVSFESSANVTGTMSLAPGAVVDADGSSGSANFTLRSTNDTPTADGTIATLAGAAAVTGNVNVERYMKAEINVNRYISTPVSVANIQAYKDDIKVDQASFKWFNEAKKNFPNSSRWTTLPSLSTSLVIGRGYAMWMYNNIPITLDVKAPINSGTLVLPVTRNNSTPPIADADGWNLLGNPYPSSIIWNGGAGWSLTNIATTVYVPDENPGGWRMFNYQDNSGDLPNGIIATAQAFWVYAGNSPALTINENAKVASGSGKFYRIDEQKNADQLAIVLQKEQLYDRAFLKINSEATDDFDWNFDAFKLKNEFLNISIQDARFRQMGMHTITALNDDEMIPIDVEVATPGDYTISFEHVNEFSESNNLYFWDSQDKEFTPLSDFKPYKFSINSGNVNIYKRFYLVKGQPSDGDSPVQIFPNPVSRQFNVGFKTSDGANVSISNINGIEVKKVFLYESGQIDINDLPAGVYLVKVQTKLGIVTNKIVKR
jgi:hypothetical protein